MVWEEVLQTMSASANSAESTFDRNVAGKNNAAIAAGSELMFDGIPRQHCFTTALESLPGSLFIARNRMVRFR